MYLTLNNIIIFQPHSVVQIYAPTTNAKDAEAEWFYEDLQGLLELTPKKMFFPS